jgi:hypothetical protein
MLQLDKRDSFVLVFQAVKAARPYIYMPTSFLGDVLPRHLMFSVLISRG